MLFDIDLNAGKIKMAAAESEAAKDLAAAEKESVEKLNGFDAAKYRSEFNGCSYEQIDKVYDYIHRKCRKAFEEKDWQTWDICHAKLDVLHNLMWEKFQ